MLGTPYEPLIKTMYQDISNIELEHNPNNDGNLIVTDLIY